MQAESGLPSRVPVSDCVACMQQAAKEAKYAVKGVSEGAYLAAKGETPEAVLGAAEMELSHGLGHSKQSYTLVLRPA